MNVLLMVVNWVISWLTCIDIGLRACRCEKKPATTSCSLFLPLTIVKLCVFSSSSAGAARGCCKLNWNYSAGWDACFKSDVELHELAIFIKYSYVRTESIYSFQDGLAVFHFPLFSWKSDKQSRGQSFRGHHRGRGRSSGRGRGRSQQRSFPHPRSHLVDDDEDIDMDGGRQRSVAR